MTRAWRKYWVYLPLLTLGTLTALPLVFMVLTSLKSLTEVLADPPIVWPHLFRWITMQGHSPSSRSCDISPTRSCSPPGGCWVF